MIIHGDSLEILKKLEPNSVDAVVTDPPYGLKFMGKKWDYDVPTVDLWRELFRVLKPGAHVLSFGGTRTYHRMVVCIEDAGFDIRDQIQWLYGSGFPKSLDVSKAIDKQAGAERRLVPRKRSDGRTCESVEWSQGWKNSSPNGLASDKNAITPGAQKWSGWGTALKPACEPIVLARKPLEKGLTVAENVLKWGTGAINVDAGRIGVGGQHGGKTAAGKSNTYFDQKDYVQEPNKIYDQGRWPANVLFDECAAEMLDEQSGKLKSGVAKRSGGVKTQSIYEGNLGKLAEGTPDLGYADSGGASRFFYVAKASKRERGPDNNHPTVKPIKLMEYLCKLIAPPGGIILDPFMGSGSTGVAAKRLGFEFIGIEREEEYCEIAKRRIEHASEQLEMPA